MYLLNQQLEYLTEEQIENLHSTMYLLNPLLLFSLLYQLHSFTFHYVSIKSKKSNEEIANEVHLHSTMYLLNPEDITPKTITQVNLHSTMYLLNP